MRSQQLINHRGSGYYVPNPVPSVGRQHILFLFYSEQPLLPTSQTDHVFIRALEQECLRRSVHLDCATIRKSPRGVEVHWPEDARPPFSRIPDNCAGIVYLVNWEKSINAPVFSWLAHAGIPVSIVDWLGALEMRGALSRKKDVQWIHSKAGYAAGIDMGKLLCGLGHRRIALFSPYADSRAEGIYKGISHACSVVPFFQQQVRSVHELETHAIKKSKRLRSVIESNPPGIPRAFSAARETLVRSSFDVYIEAVLYSLLEPSFEQALADRKITAWVGVDDSVALMLWSYLRAQGKTIPDDISIAGFDNSFASLTKDITSYDFAFPAIAASALYFLLWPQSASRSRQLVTPEIEGSIVMRGSTARIS